jgi:multisubunit Na+/H+ antiporter MnhG subunit
MGKNLDIIKILSIVIIGMFIPFLGSLTIVYGMDLTNSNDILKIASTFGYFLLIFAIELLIVFVYYKVTNKIAEEKLKQDKKK